MKITPSKRKAGERESITIKTKENPSKVPVAYKWWNAASKKDLAMQTLSTGMFLKSTQGYRQRQALTYARMYGNLPLFNFIGSSMTRINTSNNLPSDRPTMNVVQSCIDTLVSRVSQGRPRPVFLTDGGDYKERNKAKQMNGFINGEFYMAKAYENGETILRDACILGPGVVKIVERDKRVALERRLYTEIYYDANDAAFGDPRQVFEFKLVDRDVLAGMLPESRTLISRAEQGFPEAGGSQSDQTVSDQIIVCEAWHLPSYKDAKDGLHCIVCSDGLLFDEPLERQTFPFVTFNYSPRLTGPWGQGLSEQLMGTQIQINKLLMQTTEAIGLVGVPRVFVEEGSKVVKAHLNNNVGSIVTYRGTKPVYEVAPCVPQEVYAQLERLVGYAYQQAGISTMAAQAQKPAGLNSGEAIRNYDDLQSDRFASVVRRYDQFYIDLAYQMLDKAKDIALRDGKYTTIYPNKDGTKEIDLPAIDLLEDPVIQCFDSSSLPRDPSGRLQKVTEMMQGGLISPQEGRRLLDFPDIEQVDRLANAPEERILQRLDEIVESGKYTPPDPLMNIQLAEQLVTQYYNLYEPKKLEASRCEMLQDFFTQIQTLKQAAMPPPPPGAPTGSPSQMAVPQPLPQSELLPQGQ